MQTQTDNREVVSGYVLMGLAISSVVLLAVSAGDTSGVRITTATTAGFLASRLAREGIFGQALQAQIKATPTWRIFAIGIGLIAAGIAAASFIDIDGMLMPVRRGYFLISFGIVLVSAEIAISRWASGLIRDRIAAEQA